MASIGKQSERVGDHAIDGLDGHEADVERDPDPEGPAEIRGRVGMAPAKPMVLVFISVVSVVVLQWRNAPSGLWRRTCRDGVV